MAKAATNEQFMRVIDRNVLTITKEDADTLQNEMTKNNYELKAVELNVSQIAVTQELVHSIQQSLQEQGDDFVVEGQMRFDEQMKQILGQLQTS